MTPKYTLKQISEISKEIANDLDDCIGHVSTSDKQQFEIAIEILINTLIDIELC